MQLLYLLVEDFLVTVRFTAIKTAISDASVDKDFFEQLDKLETSQLRAETWFWLPDASCSLCLEESIEPPEPNPNRQQAPKGAVTCCGVSLPIRAADAPGPGAAYVSACAAELCLHPAEMQAGVCVSGQHCSLCACLPRNALFLNVGQCFISLCHSSLGYNKQLQGGGAWFWTWIV